MSTITPKHNLVKPAAIEKFSLQTYNSNLDKTDDAIPVMSRANSTLNSAQWDFRQSTFTKIKVAGIGLVVADFHGILKLSQGTTFPANTSVANEIVNAIPAAYAPLSSTGMQQGATMIGQVAGDNLQAGVNDTSLFVRSAGASFSRTSSSSTSYNITWNICWACDV